MKIHSIFLKQYKTIVPAMLALLVTTAAGYASTSGFLNLPKDMIIPDHMGTPIPPPNLTMTGYPLVVSNAPETLKSYSKPVAFYRNGIGQSRFRVFFHHMNATGRKLNIGVAITSPANGADSTEVYLSRNSQLMPEQRVSTVSKDPGMAGWIALRSWFQSRNERSGDSWIATLKPGQTRCLLQNVPHGSTVTGMYDFAVKYAGSQRSAPKVTVTVLACETPPTNPQKLSVLSPGTKTPYRRGTFKHSDRNGVIDCDVSVTPWIDIAGPPKGRFSRIMKNELEVALDDPNGYNPGNYGVVYNFEVKLRNPLYSKLRTLCLLHAAGGSGYSCTTLDGLYKEHPKLLSAYEGWIFKEIRIGSQDTTRFNIQFSLPGGCSGAHRIYFWPYV